MSERGKVEEEALTQGLSGGERASEKLPADCATVAGVMRARVRVMAEPQ